MSVAAELARINRLNNLSLVPSQPTQKPLSEIFMRVWHQFLGQGRFPLDSYKPRRTYTLRFDASTATTALPIPIYSSLTTVANTDNDTFKSDIAYVSNVYAVYNITDDSTKTTNLISSFNQTSKTITLTGAGSGTTKTWEVFCQGVPYQGLGSAILAANSGNAGDTRFRIIHDPGFMLMTTDGYAATSLTNYSPLIARLPLGGSAGKDADCSDFNGSGLKLQGGDTAMPQVFPPRSADSSNDPVNYTFYFNASATYRGVKTFTGMQYYCYCPSTNQKSVVAYPFLVKAFRYVPNSTHDGLVREGEILLAIQTQSNGDTGTNYVQSGTGANHAIDIFRIPERPIHKGEVLII